jgi:signal transduction histidine kinase
MVFIIAPLVGYWLALRVTRPLSLIISTTSQLRPDRMHERLPIRNTGDELDQLSQTVNGLLDRIANYLAQKRDFLANSAHELRTPLAAIRSTIEMALGEGRSRQEFEELLAEAIDSCSSLEFLVNQLLLLAETEANGPRARRDRVNLSEIVDKAVDMFQGVAEAKQIRLQANFGPGIAYVEGNRHHLRQVLNNLLDNAVKFNQVGGTISVELATDDRTPQAILRVRDTGIGIAAEDLPHIFERFYRCDKSRTRAADAQGNGLGLSICRAVVQAHDGQIFVDSDPGKGTTVTVSLPLARDRGKDETTNLTPTMRPSCHQENSGHPLLHEQASKYVR